MPREPVILQRDCPAVAIPAGTKVMLPKGTVVTIIQLLGGSVTASAPTGLFRIEGQDADALGMAIESGQAPQTTDGSVSETTVWDALKTCFDPEIPVNIVELGLIYDMRLSNDPRGGKRVDVKMTLTAPGCGMGPSIAADAQRKIVALQGVTDAHVDIVWEPRWNPSMISPEGRKKLGIE